ncbi:class I SAM-dependent methyltransferase [Yinghuangia aomiensis]
MTFREYIDRNYERSGCDRTACDEDLDRWMEVFAQHAPGTRPLTVVHLESEWGQLTPSLARVFGGPVFGVEPCDRVRAKAQQDAACPAVSYLDGRMSEIPLPQDSCDLVVVWPLWHEIREPDRAVREIARVLRPGGRVMLKAWFGDRLPRLPWHAWHPRSAAIERQVLPQLSQVTAAFAEAGLQRIAVERVPQMVASEAGFRMYVDHLTYRRLIMAGYLDLDEDRAGWAAAWQAVEAGLTEPLYEEYDLLVLG